MSKASRKKRQQTSQVTVQKPENKWLVPAVLSSIMLLSAVLRIALMWNSVFHDGKVWFTEVDAYYHMRVIDSLMTTWPHIMSFDPFLDFPYGEYSGVHPLLAFIVVEISKLFSLNYEMVAAILPAVCGVLLTIPVYIICRETLNKTVGLVACGIVAVLPGDFFFRTALGYADHHCLEVLLATTTFMLLILAVKKHWTWSLACGLCLGLYLANWMGGVILAVAIMGYLVFQTVYDRLKNRDISNTLYVVFLTLAIASSVASFFVPDSVSFKGLVLLTIASGVLIVANLLLSRVNKWFYPAMIIVFGVVGYFAALQISPQLHDYLSHFIPSTGNDMTILEAKSMLNMGLLWSQFNICLIAGILGLVFVINEIKAKKTAELIVLLVWVLFTLYLGIIQRRYAYYLGITIAIASGYTIWLMVKNTVSKEKVMQRVGLVVASLMMIVPSTIVDYKHASITPFSTTPAWNEALEFIRNETPDPYEQMYYQVNEPKRVGEQYHLYPENNYSVLSWWDYGHWIIREGHRPVVCSPSGGYIRQTAEIFTSMDYDVSREMIDEYRVKYIVVDYMMITYKWYAMPMYARIDNIPVGKGEFFDTFLIKLYFEGIDGYKEVFRSSQAFNQEPQVKIFEVIR